MDGTSEPEIEREHVHKVYEAIASHFSDTRWKAWPLVENFLRELPVGSLLVDVGCGNGKYLALSSKIFTLGCDRSCALTDICRKKGHECMNCDGLALPIRDEAFDAVLSIAVVHHFATVDRRLQAIREMLRILRAGGKLLISVWALEQERFREVESQDTLVPWHLKAEGCTSCTTSSSARVEKQSKRKVGMKLPQKPEELLMRYYHLFRKGELEWLVDQHDSAKVLHHAWDHDNWYVLIEKLNSH